MVVPVNPIVPVVAAAQGALPELLLQPGTTISAQVIETLADNLVRIAIAGLSIDVATEVALQPGQKLQLAVSQTEAGIRLAIVAPDSGAAATLENISLTQSGRVTSAIPGSPADQLTPLERIAVSVAAATAVTQQGSQATLFANLASVIASGSLPPGLQQAVQQVLAQQTSLDQKLDGNDIQLALQKSGLFLEATLASGSALPAAGAPDLKAALIVLRQALTSALGSSEAAPAQAASAELATLTASGPSAPSPTSVISAGIAAPVEQRAVIAEIAPSIAPEIEGHVNLQSLVLPVPDQTPGAGRAGRFLLSEALLNTGGRATTTQAALNLLQEALQQFPRSANGAFSAKVTLQDGRSDIAAVRANIPPPPFRGALPSAQPVAEPSIAPNAPLGVIAHQLLSDTDAALSRQTLLQLASLPDRVDGAMPQTDASVPRWSFEIPFMTPQGTAMAQFEIARDSGGHEVEAAKRVWRARFSLDVEPAGPIHALVSLVGERTSVRMWAERPATAAQLRAGAGDLSRALSEAELQPGDIVIRDGTPPQSSPAKAGHFLDRAL
jgi:hypothetical protein